MRLADQGKTPEEKAQHDELAALVWDAAAGLAARDRALLDLHLRHGLEGAELGEAMGMSAGNAYTALHRLCVAGESVDQGQQSLESFDREHRLRLQGGSQPIRVVVQRRQNGPLETSTRIPQCASHSGH